MWACIIVDSYEANGREYYLTGNDLSSWPRFHGFSEIADAGLALCRAQRKDIHGSSKEPGTLGPGP